MIRLKYKLTAALAIVSALPVAMVVLVLQDKGYNHLLAERGMLYHSEAAAATRSLTLRVDHEVSKLQTFCIASSHVKQVMKQANTEGSRMSAEERQTRAEEIDKRWPDLDDANPIIHTVLTNDLARQLQTFQESNPLANEIFVTDRFGYVVATTEKTSDYIQNDEIWWQKGSSLKPRDVWFDELNFDQSAGVYSLDMVLPVYSSDGEFLGVLKAVFNVAPLFASISPPEDIQADRIDIVRDDGAILARINHPAYQALSLSMPSDTMLKARDAGEQHWFLGTADDSGEERMFGIKKVAFQNAASSKQQMIVLISIPSDKITTPIRQHLTWFLTSSVVAISICLAGAIIYVRLRISKPLELLHDGTQSISMSARLREDTRQTQDRKHALQVVEDLKKIQTGDELEELAKSFSTMGSRVLRYHRHLESEVAEKTALIHQDLEMAKEFQEAMMPDEYPSIPPEPQNKTAVQHDLKLHFWHLYQPAASLGGDFFDMFQISEHRAGLFVADVMGHGARSALVTAILRALLPGIMKAAADPGDFVEQLNNHFLDIIERSGQTIFVTAFFMILDTKDKTASYVTAGHPSPIFTNRRTGNTGLLLETFRNQPALGLVPGAKYSTHSKPLEQDDVFLIFTDGLIEAENANGEMFGDHALLETIRTNSGMKIDDLSHAVVSELARFTHHKSLEDDLCLVVAEVTTNRKHQ